MGPPSHGGWPKGRYFWPHSIGIFSRTRMKHWHLFTRAQHLFCIRNCRAFMRNVQKTSVRFVPRRALLKLALICSGSCPLIKEISPPFRAHYSITPNWNLFLKIKFALGHILFLFHELAGQYSWNKNKIQPGALFENKGRGRPSEPLMFVLWSTI